MAKIISTNEIDHMNLPRLKMYLRSLKRNLKNLKIKHGEYPYGLYGVVIFREGSESEFRYKSLRMLKVYVERKIRQCMRT